MGDAVVGLFQAEGFDQIGEALAVFGEVDHVRRGAEDRDAFVVQRLRDLQRGLTAKLDNNAVQRAVLLLDPQDFHDVLERERLKIQAVRGVVVGGDSLGVAVDHDRLVARVCEGVAGVAAAIVELDPLADAVGAAAEDDDLLAVGGAGLAFHVAHHGGFIGGVHVGCLRLELGGAGVDAFEDGFDAEVQARAADVVFVAAGQFAKAGVCEAHHLDPAQAVFGDGEAVLADAFFGLDDLADAGEEPRVEHGGGVDVLVGHAVAHGLCNGAHAVGGGFGDGFGDGGLVGRTGDFDFIKSGQARFHRRERFLQGLVDGAADGHRLAYGLHGGGQVRLGAGEFLEGEFRDLGDDVVDGRLEGRGRHTGDVVVQLVQREAHGEFCGDFRDGEAGGLGRERGGARHAGVHLDHDHAAIGGVHRPLHVRSAGFHADLAQDRDRVVAHDLVFFVRECQRRRHCDAVARVDAHWVHVFDATDDDGVVSGVPDHFHLELFPAQQRFVDEDLAHGRGVHAGAAVEFVIFAVVGNAAAGAAHGEGGADDGGQADFFQCFQCDGNTCGEVFLAVCVFGCGANGRLGVFDAQTVHRLTEQLAILGHFDGFALGADHLDAEFLQHAHFFEGERGVEAGLAAHGRQQRIGALFFDDLCHDLGGDRLDIGGVRKAGIGHDGCRVGVDEDDAVAFLFQRLARLSAGIVELAGLTDDNRPCTNDHDRLDVGSLWHGLGPLYLGKFVRL